eukprot:TRINITY_DN20147_c0_g1_i1.p1 TRINITY_DN20147_c0_g1~~TRINITY_DN20147_c0_g1_i1.p1  ORF type:complete len:454 (+),score=82.57 TRINITY_DN20147_c0_g1_i1:59-1420(+)
MQMRKTERLCFTSLLLCSLVVFSTQGRFQQQTMTLQQCLDSRVHHPTSPFSDRDLMTLTALVGHDAEQSGTFYLIRVGLFECNDDSLSKAQTTLDFFVQDPAIRSLSNLAPMDQATGKIRFAVRATLMHPSSTMDSWAGINIKHVVKDGAEYFVGFLPTIFLDGQSVRFIVDYHECRMAMSSYRGANSCKSEIGCCKEWYKPTVQFTFIPPVARLYADANPSVGYWKGINAAKKWIPFNETISRGDLPVASTRPRHRTIHVVGDSVYEHLYDELLQIIQGRHHKPSVTHSTDCFLWAGCVADSKQYGSADNHVLSNVELYSSKVDVVIFSFGSHAPYITTDELGYYVDLSLEIMQRFPNVSYIVNGLSDSPALYMLQTFKDTQLCTRNSYTIAQTNLYLSSRYDALPNVKFFDPFHLTFSALSFAHNQGDPVHFADRMVYRAWSELFLRLLDG